MHYNCMSVQLVCDIQHDLFLINIYFFSFYSIWDASIKCCDLFMTSCAKLVFSSKVEVFTICSTLFSSTTMFHRFSLIIYVMHVKEKSYEYLMASIVKKTLMCSLEFDSKLIQRIETIFREACCNYNNT